MGTGRRPKHGLVRDQRGLSTLEYASLFAILCCGMLLVWGKLGSDFACQLRVAQAEFAAKLSGAPSPLPVDCSSQSAAASGAGLPARPGAWPAYPGALPPSAAGSNLPGSQPGSPSRVEDPAARAPSKPGQTPAKPPIGQWTQDILKVMCPADKAFLQQLKASGVKIKVYDDIYFDDPYFDGHKWTTKRFPAGGTTQGKSVELKRTGNPATDASTIYHEGVHTQQPRGMQPRDAEYEAYTREDAWRLARNLPPRIPGFRTTNAAGQVVTDPAAVRKFVDTKYPGVTVASPTGGAPDRIIGRKPNGDTVLERANGTQYSRPARAGDTYESNTSVTKPPNGYALDMAKLQCP